MWQAWLVTHLVQADGSFHCAGKRGGVVFEVNTAGCGDAGGLRATRAGRPTGAGAQAALRSGCVWARLGGGGGVVRAAGRGAAAARGDGNGWRRTQLVQAVAATKLAGSSCYRCGDGARLCGRRHRGSVKTVDLVKGGRNIGGGARFGCVTFLSAWQLRASPADTPRARCRVPIYNTWPTAFNAHPADVAVRWLIGRAAGAGRGDAASHADIIYYPCTLATGNTGTMSLCIIRGLLVPVLSEARVHPAIASRSARAYRVVRFGRAR